MNIPGEAVQLGNDKPAVAPLGIGEPLSTSSYSAMTS
jgi:hypothetical protein